MQQARKGRAEHAVKCKLMLGKRISKRQLLTELYAKTEVLGRQKSQRHCAVVYVDPVEATDEQKKWIMKYNEDGDGHFTEQGRVAEITVDLVLQARAKMSENEVNGGRRCRR